MQTRTLPLALLATMLAACPWDPEAAGLRQVDGGYIYDNGMDGGVFLPAVADVDAAAPKMYIDPPSMDKLCMLWMGDVNNENDNPYRFGTWIGDVERIFGKPQRGGGLLGKKQSNYTYIWQGPNLAEPSGMDLSFEFVNLIVRAANGDPTTMAFDDAYFLTDIQLHDGSYLKCWRWEQNDPGHVDCPGQCFDLSKYYQCQEPDVKDCYR